MAKGKRGQVDKKLIGQEQSLADKEKGGTGHKNKTAKETRGQEDRQHEDNKIKGKITRKKWQKTEEQKITRVQGHKETWGSQRKRTRALQGEGIKRPGDKIQKGKWTRTQTREEVDLKTEAQRGTWITQK